MPAARIITSGGLTFNFLSMTTISGGFLLEFPATEVEELTTPGVDGARWRTVSLQHRKVIVQTVSEYTLFTDATFAASTMVEISGLVDVEISAGNSGSGYNVKRKNVHVGPVFATPRIGQPVGGGASASSGAHVIAEWTLQLTKFDPSTTE